MGKISNRLIKLCHQELSKKIVNLSDVKKGRKNAKENLEQIKSVEYFLNEGRDFNQAVYYNTQNLVSVMMDDLIMLKPLESIHRFCAKVEDLYQPGYPPMSPITGSYYNLWIQFDAAFGDDKETIGSCILDLADIFQIKGLQKVALQNFCNSRMGLYEVLQPKGLFYRVRELVTELEFEIKLNSGYVGQPGDLLLLRILPSLDETNIHTGMTTPYQVEGYSKQEWLEYFVRHNIKKDDPDYEKRLHTHFKYGLDRMYWSEYIFWAYLQHRSDVVFLTGIPDRVSTQPHHEKFSAVDIYNKSYDKIEPLLKVQPILTSV